MSYSGGIISAPVQTIDIATALGTASRDIGTLCQHANINKWAKNKPFRADLHGAEATTQDRIDANYGLNFVVSAPEIGNDVVGAVIQAAKDTSCYSYDTTTTGYNAQGKPRGLAYNEGFRERDFDGYRHNAPAPINGFTNKKINLYNFPSEISLEIYSTDIDDNYQISLADVIAGVRARMGIDLTNWYIILAWRYGSTGGYYTVSQENIGQSSRRFNFSITNKNQMPIGQPDFYLAAVSDKTPNYYSRICGLPFLRADISGYGWGTFDVVSEVPFQFTWMLVDTYSGWPYTGHTWEYMADRDQYRAKYYQYHDQSGVTDVPLQLTSDCDMAYGFEVENTSAYAARLTLSQIKLQSGLSVGASGWYNGGPTGYPTGQIDPSYAYYSTSKSANWQQFPTSGSLDLSAGQTIYLWIVAYQFQRYYNGSLASAINGQSTHGAEMQLYYASKKMNIVPYPESQSWERPALINIKYGY